MFEKSDGSGRPLRPVQEEAFQFLRDNWSKPVIAMNLPCGSGKTLLARSILNEDPGAIYITSENTLVRQMSDIYPELNTLIGKRN